MTKDSDITLSWLPSERPSYSASELINKLNDKDLASIYYLEASNIARQLKIESPREPFSGESADDYLKFLESKGFSAEKIYSSFDAINQCIDEQAEINKKKAVEFMRLYEENFPFVPQDFFDTYVNTETLEYIIDYAVTHSRRLKAKRNALKKLKNDTNGKQAAKKNVRECWDTWQKKPEQYGGKSAFARAMLDKYEALGSQQVIVRWCTEWESAPS